MSERPSSVRGFLRRPPDLPRLARFAAPAAGPSLIVLGVLVVLRNFAFQDLLSVGDVRTLWLPTYCFLGKSLANGHIPAWNPFSMAGVPFAADPQSGWMYLPPMALFSLFSCSFAIRWMIVLQPILAGVGLYWFLRGEALSRPAATVGGLALALGIAGSKVSLALPFSASLAWTALTLAACSRYLRADAWPRRVLWLLLTAISWGQLAAAHLSVGLLTGTLALVFYVAGQVWGRRVSRSIVVIGLLPVSLFLVNLAFLLPRLAYAPRTSLGLGYYGLTRYAATLGDRGIVPRPITTGPVWPLKLATPPGVYLGAATLGLGFAGWWLRRHRLTVITFGVFGALCYVLGVKVMSQAIPASFRSNRVVDFYLHNPYWTIFQVFLVLSVLGAIGLEAWREERSARTRAGMLVPASIVWVILPIAFGGGTAHLLVPAFGAVATGVVLFAAVRGWVPYAAVPAVLAVELVLNGVRTGPVEHAFHPPPSLGALPRPVVNLPKYTTPGVIHLTLERSGSRYATIGGGKVFDRTTNEGTLFGAESVDAYNAVQLRRYWLFVRALQQPSIKYNRSYFFRPQPSAFDLLEVNWTVARRPNREVVSTRDSRRETVVNDGDWTLYRRPRSTDRAEVMSSWTVVKSSEEALSEVSRPGFDPSSSVVLERAPGLRPSPTDVNAEAHYRWTSNQSATIEVRTSVPGLLLVKNPFDEGWHATVDRRASPVLAADYVVQAVPVPAGSHTVELTYDDPSIGYGLLGSSLSVLALLAFARVAAVKKRSEVRSAPETET